MRTDDVRRRLTAAVILAIAAPLTLAVADSRAQAPPDAEIEANGTVRVCDANGDFVDSDGDQYGIHEPRYLVGPPPTFKTSYSCLGRTQRFNTFQSADPFGEFSGGFSMKSDVGIAVDFEPHMTDVYGRAKLSQQVCFFAAPGAGLNPATAKVTVFAHARGTRSITPTRCVGNFGETADTTGPCSSAVGRFGGLGAGGLFDRNGRPISPFEFYELDQPSLVDADGTIRLSRAGRLIPGNGGYYLEAGVSGTVITAVGSTFAGTATAEMSYWIETDPAIQHASCTPIPPDAARVADISVAPDVLPKPAWWINAGDAVPGDFTLAISPPTGVLAFNQQFDIALMAATNGATLTGITGSIDGLNVTGPLAGCLRPTSLLSGVQGGILTCRGISGGFLAGIFGLGAHTFNVSLTLSDGRTISDSVTWTIRR
jgi:hypothetical protein